jgi:hypothetical protein
MSVIAVSVRVFTRVTRIYFNMLTQKAFRLDMDDLGGEIILLDWGSLAGLNRQDFLQTSRNKYLKRGDVDINIYQESKTCNSSLEKRIIPLENNEMISRLSPDSKDPVLEDIRQIPFACKKIQQDWNIGGLNRYTAWNLVRRIKQRLQARIDDKIPSTMGTVDILLTGCEVSLWVAEQFASDLKKAFPKLNVQAVSSNKLLSVFGQELSMPAIGFPISEQATDLKQTITIIVSHSGQTFAHLACASLLQ